MQSSSSEELGPYARKRPRFGDVYRVDLDGNTSGYYQVIGKDPERQWLIRVLPGKHPSPLDASDLAELVAGPHQQRVYIPAGSAGMSGDVERVARLPLPDGVTEILGWRSLAVDFSQPGRSFVQAILHPDGTWDKVPEGFSEEHVDFPSDSVSMFALLVFCMNEQHWPLD